MDALPAGARLSRLVRACRVRGGPHPCAGAGLVPRPHPLRGRRDRCEAHPRPVARRARAAAGPTADAGRAAALRRPVLARLGRRRRVHPDRRRPRLARAAAAMTATTVVAAPARAASVLWRFSRPHTIIGTAISVAGLLTIVVAAHPGASAGTIAFQGFWTLVAALSVNVFIVGINQISDVEIDRVNKPYLPIAAGDLSPEAAWWIVAATALLPLGLALTQGVLETVAVAAALAIGAAYSLPPI